MNIDLTEKQQSLKKNFSDFAKAELEPIAYEDDRYGKFPEGIIKKIAGKDFFGLTIPKEYGGCEGDFVSVAVLAEEFAKSNGAAAAITMSHLVMAEQTILKYGNEEQKKKYLPDMVKGNKLGGYAYEEPGASLASGENKVVAAKTGSSYALTGEKTIVANGGAADVYVVIAQTDEAEGLNGLSAFIVDAGDIGVVRKVGKLGLRSFPTAEIEFKGTKAQLLGKENEGINIVREIQARVDIVCGAMGVGIGSTALKESVEHSKTRIQFGFPLSKLQAVQWMIAEMAEDLHVLNTLTYEAACCVDSKKDYLLDTAYLKMFGHKAVFEIGSNAIQVLGGTGYSRESSVERYFRDLRGLFNYASINEYPQKIIAGNLLK